MTTLYLLGVLTHVTDVAIEDHLAANYDLEHNVDTSIVRKYCAAELMFENEGDAAKVRTHQHMWINNTYALAMPC